MCFFPVKRGTLYLALLNSLRLVQLNSHFRQTATEMCVDKGNSEAGQLRLMGVFQMTPGSPFHVHTTAVKFRCQVSSWHKNAWLLLPQIHVWINIFESYGQCSSGTGNIPRGECNGVEPFHATKCLSWGSPCSLPEPSGRHHAGPGCVLRVPRSATAAAGERKFRTEPPSQTAIHVSHFPPLKTFPRWTLNRPGKRPVNNPLNKHLILHFGVFKIQHCCYLLRLFPPFQCG